MKLLAALLLMSSNVLFASNQPTTVPLKTKGADTYYAKVDVEGYGSLDYLVDTGAGYMTINNQTLKILQTKNLATFVYDLLGQFADGRSQVVPVYRIASINIGGDCKLTNVEAAVLPGTDRCLLGLSALKRAGSFLFSFDPPALTLNNCVTPST